MIMIDVTFQVATNVHHMSLEREGRRAKMIHARRSVLIEYNVLISSKTQLACLKTESHDSSSSCPALEVTTLIL